MIQYGSQLSLPNKNLVQHSKQTTSSRSMPKEWNASKRTYGRRQSGDFLLN